MENTKSFTGSKERVGSMSHQTSHQQSLAISQLHMSAQPRINAVYYPNYRVSEGQTPAKLNYKCINMIFYAFANVSPNGTVALSNEEVDLKMPIDGASGHIGSFMRLREQYKDLKVILSIGGGDGSVNFHQVAASSTARDNFARTTKNLVETLGFNGVDIDWEEPDHPERYVDYLELLKAIRVQLPPFRYYLTATLPAGEWALRHINLSQLQIYVDFLNLMAYDFFGPWTTKTGNHAQLFTSNAEEDSGDKAVKYVSSQGYPISKILLGVPLFGKSFPKATGPGQINASRGGSQVIFTFSQLPRPGSKQTVDTRVVAAYCVGSDGGFVTYDNPETVRIKANYCNLMGLAGLFYWEVTQDAPPGPQSLISTGFNALNGFQQAKLA